MVQARSASPSKEGLKGMRDTRHSLGTRELGALGGIQHHKAIAHPCSPRPQQLEAAVHLPLWEHTARAHSDF